MRQNTIVKNTYLLKGADCCTDEAKPRETCRDKDGEKEGKKESKAKTRKSYSRRQWRIHRIHNTWEVCC